MNSRNRPFFKGFPGYSRPNLHQEARDAEETVYYWWWRFLRLSPVIWFAHSRDVLPKDERIAQVIKDFGDLSTRGFTPWWLDTGRNLFSESIRPERVSVLDLANLQDQQFFEDRLYVEIPLNIRKQTIVSQLKQLLNERHEGRYLDLAATSTAQYALFTKRYRMRVLETEYWVMLYRLLYPKTTVWQIGDRLQISPSFKVRGVDNKAHHNVKNNPMSRLNSLTGRFLYKARFTTLNAERGIFPSSKLIELGERYQPFGLKLQTEYRQATESNGKEVSEWQQCLSDLYKTELRLKIMRSNNISIDDYGVKEYKIRQRITDFIEGKSDLII
jgi:hypothetical protein